MSLSERDRRALILLGVAVAAVLIYRLASDSDSGAAVQASETPIPIAEKSLNQLRRVAATVPGKERILAAVTAQVNDREKKLLAAETGAQAQAQLLQIARRVAHSEGPPIEIGQVSMGQVQTFGKYYGEALVTMSFVCTIDQLVNYLADLSAQPEMIATNELHVNLGDIKQKTLNVRLTLSALIPRNLAPERKGFGVF